MFLILYFPLSPFFCLSKLSDLLYMFHPMAAEGMSYCWWQKSMGDFDVTCPSASLVGFTIGHACFYKCEDLILFGVQ